MFISTYSRFPPFVMTVILNLQYVRFHWNYAWKKDSNGSEITKEVVSKIRSILTESKSVRHKVITSATTGHFIVIKLEKLCSYHKSNSRAICY